MAETNVSTDVLDDLLSTLEGATAKQSEGTGGDAIDRVLSRTPRTTAVRSLRDAPEVTAFRDGLVEGLIRVDTANQLLRLVNTLVTQLL